MKPAGRYVHWKQLLRIFLTTRSTVRTEAPRCLLREDVTQHFFMPTATSLKALAAPPTPTWTSNCQVVISCIGLCTWCLLRCADISCNSAFVCGSEQLPADKRVTIFHSWPDNSDQEGSDQDEDSDVDETSPIQRLMDAINVNGDGATAQVAVVEAGDGIWNIWNKST